MPSIRIVVGIDEAGRGPVVGDMVIAGVALEESSVEKLSRLGVRDSKKLDPSRRERLLGFILSECIAAAVVRVPPEVIDRENLNKIFARGCARIMRILSTILEKSRDIQSLEVFIDSCGDPRRLEALIKSYLGPCRRPINIHLEHGADAKYIPVAAASIVAKVLRDKHIELLKRVYGDFGSGYPSDRRTIEWLEHVTSQGRIPPIVRKSWGTVKKLLQSRSSLLRYLKKEQK